ncbi:MAG: ion channel [Candidatus Omnitrophota bacterium]
MNKFKFLRTIENKYSHLLVSIILLFLLAPFMERFFVVFPITHSLLFIIIILTLRILKVTKPVYIVVICLGAIAVFLEYLVNKGVIPSTNNNAIIVLLASYVLFIGTAIIFLIKNVFSEKNITADTIKGGISIYLLMGFWWVFLYYLIIVVNPGAIISTIGEELNLVRLYQFSFATLTTVGYGDTIPKGEVAVTLSNFEAVAGQVYLTVFIARLVGMGLLAKAQKE